MTSMTKEPGLFFSVDSIVMLTWSDWFTELRSNRYHYASRFAKTLPVYFVQPDLDKPEYKFQKTEIPNIIVIHIYRVFDETQRDLLNSALLEARVLRPIFWIYNIYFERFLSQRYSLFNVYHATEDYLASDSPHKFRDRSLLDLFNKVLERCNLLIAVSEGVADGIERYSTFKGKIFTVTNGCDYKFYAPTSIDHASVAGNKNIAFYQGNIFNKLDYALLIELAKRMPTWTFKFCGRVISNESLWRCLCKLPNVEYLGLLSAEEVRKESYLSTVGLIPFIENELLIERSFPLKTFEYLATALPVVSVPIKGLLPYADTICLASGVDEFEKGLNQANVLRQDSHEIKKRLSLAATQDYDLKFEQVISEMENLFQRQHPSENESFLSVRILYSPEQMKNKANYERLKRFSQFSRHDIFYIPACEGYNDSFINVDVLVIYFPERNFIPQAAIQKIKNFGGYKALLLDTNVTLGLGHFIKEIGVHALYSYSPKINYSDFGAVKLMVMPMDDLSSKDIAFFDETLQQIDKLVKKEPITSISSLVAFKKDEMYLAFNPEHFFTMPSKNIFSVEDLAKKRIELKKDEWQLMREILNNIHILFVLFLKKILIGLAKKGYEKSPKLIKHTISRMVPRAIKMKVFLKG